MPIENPTVKEYLLKRKQERDALEGQVKEESSGPNIAAALAAIGAGFQGRDSLAAGQSMLERQEKARKAKLTDFDTGTDRYIKDVDTTNTAEKMDREKSMLAADDDVNSEESKIATELAARMGYKGGPISATKFKQFSPYYQKMHELEQRKIDNELNRSDRRLARETSNANRQHQRAELSVAQAKQAGLYKSGALADEQYARAVADKGEYDPTEVGQVIDNSEWAPNWMKNDKAIEAQAAQRSWVESFLRDASGAAIPESERMSYAADFFPRPGDTPEVIANKNALRRQKMENARVGSGEDPGSMVAGATQPKTPRQAAMEELERRNRMKQTAGR